MVLGWLFDKLRGHCSGPRRDPKLAASQRSGVKRRSCCFRARLRGPPPNTGNSSQTFTPYRKLSIPTPYRIITIGCEFALSRCELAVKMEASISFGDLLPVALVTKPTGISAIYDLRYIRVFIPRDLYTPSYIRSIYKMRRRHVASMTLRTSMRR